ncbi:hypothetical protein JW823_01515 [bacterium]|nr:hypothetical protein [candidate division CSSED10-310 bacterium]
MMEGSREAGAASFQSADDKWAFRWQLSGPSQDPFLLVDFENDGLAVLFDCGVRVWGKVKTILKVRHLLITHAHIDHLIGFDHIIRSLLGENKTLFVHGPEGITRRLSAKLEGYDWDKSAEQELILDIREYRDGVGTRSVLACNRRFEPVSAPETFSVYGPIIDEKHFAIHTVRVAHGGSPCLAYVLSEKDSVRIDKDRLDALGVEPGPWVGELIRRVEAGSAADNDLITVGGSETSISDLVRDLVRVRRGRVVVYITDTVYEDGWVDRLKELATGADLVVCESTFLQADSHLASVYHHLTSVQAARIARELDARQLMLFHVSSRYHPNLFQAVQEARSVFPRTDMIQPARRTQSRRGRKVSE